MQAVSAAGLDPQLKHLNLRENLFTAEEQSLLEDVLSVLKPLKTATLFVRGESQPTASRILPTLTKLNQEMTARDEDSPAVVQMKANITGN